MSVSLYEIDVMLSEVMAGSESNYIFLKSTCEGLINGKCSLKKYVIVIKGE